MWEVVWSRLMISVCLLTHLHMNKVRDRPNRDCVILILNKYLLRNCKDMNMESGAIAPEGLNLIVKSRTNEVKIDIKLNDD